MKSFQLSKGQSFKCELSDNDKKMLLVGAASGMMFAPGAAMASTAELTTAIEAAGTLAGVAIPVCVTAMGYRIGAKLVNRIAAKG